MRAKWDKTGERFFQTGTDRGMLYSYDELEYKNGVPWNGLISMRIGPTGSTAFDGKLYRSSIKRDIVQSYNEYNGKITCYTYPDEFEPCLGYTEVLPGMYFSQQERPMFGLSYRTLVGNDVEGLDHAYKLHLVYNCVVVTDDGETETIGDEVQAEELIFDLETFPVDTDLLENPSSEVVFDSRKLAPDQLTLLESILYGTDEEDPRMPYPDELVELLSEAMPDNRTYPNSNTYPNNGLYPMG